MKVSVVMSCYQRGPFIEETLRGYLRQSMPPEDYELIFVDDWSTDNTEGILFAWAKYLPIVYMRTPYKEPGTWRAGSTAINYGVRASKGELIIASHPEVIPGRLSLELMYEHRQERTYHVCKAYYLSIEQQALLATVNFGKKGTLAVRDIPGFYDNHPAITGAARQYWHKNVDEAWEWQNNLFSGGLRSYWREMGGYYPFQAWGSQDVWCARVRTVKQIPNATETHPETICVHQNHDALSSEHRNSQRALDQALQAPLEADEVWR